MNLTGNFPRSQVKRHLDVKLGKMLQPKQQNPADELLPYLRAANIGWGRIDYLDTKEMWFSPNDRSSYELRSGDMVVLEGGDVGRAAIVDEIAGFFGFQNSVHRVRPKPGEDIRFASYWMRHLKDRGYIDLVCSKATLAHFTAEKFLRSPFPSVNYDKQKTIADFLDRETARIDQLIEKKERLVGLLNERVNSSLSDAVLRPSEAGAIEEHGRHDWLGPVPSAWPLSRVGWELERITYGFTNPMPTEDDGPYMLTANDIGDGEIRWSSARRTSRLAYTDDLTDKSRPRKGDVLLTKDGTLGRVAVHDGREACINQSVALLRVRSNRLLSDFLAELLRTPTYQDRMIFEAGGTTIKHIYITRLARMPLPLPDLEQQKLIVGTVALVRERSMLPRRLVVQSIERLQEFRSALITAAVTGQIDVTKWGKQGGTDRRLDQIEEEMSA